MPASLVLGWTGDVVLGEQKRRFGEVPSAFPEPNILPERLPVSILLWKFVAEPFQADPNAQDLEALIRLFEAASARLDGEMARSGVRVHWRRAGQTS